MKKFDYRGLKVPKVLLSGNHKLIKNWRERQREIRTKSRRPDLYELWERNNSLLNQKKIDLTNQPNLSIDTKSEFSYPDW